MKISIIVPVYNAGQYLNACLQSIADQDYADFEVIVVDDGSTDTSAEVCDAFCAKYKNFKVHHTPNRGVSAARNLGVSEATGEYVTFVDSDDIVHPQYLSVLHGMLSEEAVASMCDFTQRSVEAMTVSGKVRVMDVNTAIERTLYQRGCDCSLWCKLLPREAVLKAPQPTGLRYEDLATFYKIYQNLNGKIAKTSARPYYYRRNPTSYINTFTPSRLDVLTVTDNIVEDLSYDKNLHRAALDRRFSANYNMYLLCKKHGLTSQAKKCRQLIKKYRLSELLNPKVRLKNRLGALAAFFLVNSE